MREIRIFLASSEELKSDRECFEIEIYRKCKMWFSKGIFFHLDIWEDLSAKVSPLGSSQSDYNEVIKQADILVLLAHTKVGIYTEQEFEVAFGQFQTKKKPFIYTYFKNGVKESSEKSTSLLAFQNKLAKLGHFYSRYNDFSDLWNQFNKELDRLNENEFTEMIVEFQNRGSDANDLKIKQVHSGVGDNIGRDKIIGK